MSIATYCPYSEERENCKYEIYDGQPKYDKCSTCNQYRTKVFTDKIESSEFSLSEIQEYSHKLFKSFDSLDFKSNYNYALQAVYLGEKLYVVRCNALDKYQYTLVEADSEIQAIRKCF